jgi:copper chaperone CopZ
MRTIGFAVILVLAAGCSKPASETSPISTNQVNAAMFNQAGAPTIQFSVPDMMCQESCAVRVKEILAEAPGAKDVIVDFDTKTATVAIEESRFDAQQALAALVDHHFDNSSLKDAATNTRPADAEATATLPAPVQ